MIIKTRQGGFSLIELLVVMSMAAILLGIAVPSFSQFLKKNRIQADQRSLLADLSVARNKAIEGNTVVSVCAKAANTETCADSDDWSNGWLIFVDDASGTTSDNAANGSLEGSEELVLIFDAKSNNSIDLQDEPSGDNIVSVSFSQRGYLLSSKNDEQASILFCEPDDDAKFARAIFVELTGRAVGSRDKDSNGIHEAINGADISC
ncbi:GspH/FimT family pseudopilin [Agaribacterium haliotis]|uniref:GspH/FimT family pseudopilin n=1 Tax=Agaribacterium haliotis TaxID=2013869 RepID=UPI00130420FB|nr:GspH/FimT family pseudopilin [Agaribacterium haliotis]